MSTTTALPLLWHLKVSSYNEKARWALDYKEFPHTRRASEPGRHTLVAKRLAGTRTFPILVIDGKTIPDSTRIIEELERRRPDPPLYPAAALVAPAVAPPEFPYPQPQRDHPALAPVRDALGETGMLEWAREMYARHRGTSAEMP